ncbi:spore coat protein [Paenibacillus turpanensis]|uniref:spore coat protein n=1 Tax=Paenibacillus turpanensis TaxID=2689078 RepID=UPI00140E8E3A|nr:spore coat protein [Paenibacillus turpanensis]
MNEKDMVLDYLHTMHSNLMNYAIYIAHTDNQSLRQALIDTRNFDEQRQYDFYQLAFQKGYYQPADAASPQDIQEVRSLFTVQ